MSECVCERETSVVGAVSKVGPSSICPHGVSHYDTRLRHKITMQHYERTLLHTITTQHTTLLHSNTIHTSQLQHNITTQRYYYYCIALHSTILENTLVDTSKRAHAFVRSVVSACREGRRICASYAFVRSAVSACREGRRICASYAFVRIVVSACLRVHTHIHT